MTGRVIVVGSVNIDLVVTSARLPDPGETVISGIYSQHHGGKGGNQAVAAARSGGRVAFVGAVGDDAFGRDARGALEAEGVDTSELLTLPGVATGVALIQVDAVGENTVNVAGGANRSLLVDLVRGALERLQPRRGDVVLVGHEIPTVVATAALAWGREAGATTILNPAPAHGLDAATVALADVATPNEGELAVLHAAGQMPTTVLVSLGAAGARLTTPDGDWTIAAPKFIAIDTVGAGDTLNGALAAGIAAGLPLPEAARRAVWAASLAVTRAGAREGMPTRAEVDAALTA
ncbi:MAG: ribokinase [Candidatus Limnocylindrales bacterium]